MFVAATMRRVHRTTRRTMSCQASVSRRWTQIIRGGEDRTTRECKIEATFRARWWRVREWQRKLSHLAMPHSRHVLYARARRKTNFLCTEYSILLTLVLLSVSLAHWDTIHDTRHNGACVYPAHWVTRITQIGQARPLFCPPWGVSAAKCWNPLGRQGWTPDI